MIYLDYASHTPPCQAALDAFIQAEKNATGNANARHTAGLTARQASARATRGICLLMGADTADVLAVSGAGEGNHRAIMGLAQAYRHRGRHIVSTCYAHPSENAALAALTEQGFEISHVRIDRDGVINLAHLNETLRNDTILFCVSAVDSELGVVQPLEEIATIMRAFPHCHLHIDAAQAVGKVPLLSFDALGAATMTFSAHKFYGVGGSGVLLRRKGIILDGTYDGGTPAIGLLASCHAALEEALREMPARTAYVTRLHATLADVLAQYPAVRFNSPGKINATTHNAIADNGDTSDANMPHITSSPFNPYILNLSVDGVRGTAFRDALDRHGVCVSVKAACATDHTPSRPVQAISDKKNALSSWRISLSHLTTPQELDAFLHIFKTCYTELTTS